MTVRIFLKSGQVIKVKLKEVSINANEIRWTNFNGSHEKLLRVERDEIAAITYKGR